MKTNPFFLLLFLFFASATAAAQNSAMEDLLNSKTFTFFPDKVMSSGFSGDQFVQEGYVVRFFPDSVYSSMPYYGSCHSGITSQNNRVMRFQEKIKTFSVEKDRHGFVVKTKVRTRSNSYSLTLSVAESGYATLVVTSRNCEPITYSGEVGTEKKASE